MLIKIKSNDITLQQLNDMFQFIYGNKISFTLYLDVDDLSLLLPQLEKQN